MEPCRDNSFDTFEYRPQIEGLRAIAIIFVVLYHCNVTIASGGYIGVDLFFVLSGYLISSILLQELNSTGSIGFLSFYSRRAQRILPESSITLLLCCLLVYFCFDPREATPYLAPLRNAALSIENWGLLATGEDYWDQPRYPSPVLHYWSLSIGEQLYVAFPVFLLAIYYLVGQDMEKLLPVCVFITIGSAYLTGTVDDDSVRHLNTFCRIYQCGAGTVVALYVWKSAIAVATTAGCAVDVLEDGENGVSIEMQTFLPENGEDVGDDEATCEEEILDISETITIPDEQVGQLYKYTLLPVGIVVILMTGCEVFSYLSGEPTNSKYSSFFSVFGCTLCLAGIEESRKNEFSEMGYVTKKIMWFLESRPMVYVGKVSYGIYLVHWPIIVFCIKQLKMISFLYLRETNFFPSLGRVLVVLGVSIIIATVYRYGIYRSVLTHIALRNHREQVAMMIAAVLIPLILVVFFYSLLYLPASCVGYFDGAYVTQPGFEYVIEKQRVEELIKYVQGALPTDTTISIKNDASWAEWKGEEHHRKPPIQDRDWYLDVDMNKYVHHELFTYMASSPDRPRVLIVGDSHSLMFYEAAKLLAKEKDLNMIHEEKEGCRPLYSSTGPCDFHIALVIQLAKRFKPHLVVMFSLFSLKKNPTINIQENGVMTHVNRKEERYWDVVEDAFARLLEEISPHAGTVAVVQPEPIPTLHDERESIPDCVCKYSEEKALIDSGYCNTQEITYIPEMMEVSSLIENSLLHNNVDITLDDVLCPNRSCPAVFDDNRVTYGDKNGHVSPLYWAKKREEVWGRLAQLLT